MNNHLSDILITFLFSNQNTGDWFYKALEGRPVHIYKPTTHLSEILNAFEQEKLKEVESFKKDISELKNLIKSR